MTKEIIIDDCNVAECEFYYEMDDCDGCHQLCNNATDIKNEYCEHYKNCYFKQLQRLKKAKSIPMPFIDETLVKELKQENKIYKQAFEEIRDIAKEGSKSVFADEDCDKIIDKINEVLNDRD